MTRWDYDGIFYRVFCITLLGTAVAFTIILTNVFVDIDGLITNERGINHNDLDEHVKIHNNDDITTKTYVDHENRYRTKRSLETKNFQFHIRNQKMKNILTKRLVTLLDELDSEDKKARSQNESETTIENNTEENTNVNETINYKKENSHYDIHKILLKGIIGRMDFNEVYDTEHNLVSENVRENKVETTKEASNEVENFKVTPTTVEQKIFDEIMNCKELRQQVVEANKKIKEYKRNNTEAKGPKVIIKAVIDIKSLPSKQNNKPETNSNENVKGLIKLIYNGKAIKFSRISDEATVKSENNNNTKKVQKESHLENKDISKFIEEYIKRNANYEMSEVKQETKRIKRHIKIRYNNDNSKIDESLHKSIPKKKEDDELFVEIETHFDSKGTTGEKKKKLIRNLIDKIQKAIHSKSDVNKNKQSHLHVKKRIQNPLQHKNKDTLVNKLSIPYNAMVHRHLDPISKVIPIHESIAYMVDKSSQIGPKFLADTKSINSAEMSEVNVDYNKFMYMLNGIPQRMQKPLNIDSDENIYNNAYNDLGKLNFLLKDIDGSGFSIGFNQYVDQPPDKEAMKLFTGLENIIQTYHQTYDPVTEADKSEVIKNNNDETDNVPIEHVIVRRSIDRFSEDQHSNEYKIIFTGNFLPYQNYQDIYNSKVKEIKNIKSTKFVKNDEFKETPLIDDIFNKNLKPSEIFDLANLIHRKKRSVNLKKISNLKKKIKLSRYLNTRAMATKRIFLNKKRSKRQVDKIRIIATDNIPNIHRNSDENIFLVSDENLFADRALVKAVEMPEIEHDKIIEDHYDVITPYVYEEPPSYATNTFGGNIRHNSLMSKYPHIFMEEISRSKEEIPENPLIFNKHESTLQTPIETSTMKLTTQENIPLPKVEEIVNAISPQNGKTNYKVTVKITPKNATDMNSGFKEIHTSINKSYNKNGLVYSSLVNVSEISKIVKINKTDTRKADITTQSAIIFKISKQRENLNSLLQQHKERIEEQLKHLNREKEKLDIMTLTTEPEFEDTTPNYFDVVLPLDPPKILRLTKEEVNKLAIASLLQLQNPVVDIPSPTTAFTTTPTTTESPKQIERKLIKQKTKMIKKIEKNENLTNEILKKIDKNTEILQTFLTKLTENIKITEKHKTERKHLETVAIPEAIHQIMPNISAKNSTHVSIPFIYAYQQPHPLTDKKENPMTNVLYHGHIHANTINKEKTESWPSKDKNIKNTKINQTKFFIDELENDFKIAPNSIKNDYLKLINNTILQ